MTALFLLCSYRCVGAYKSVFYAHIHFLVATLTALFVSVTRRSRSEEDEEDEEDDE